MKKAKLKKGFGILEVLISGMIISVMLGALVTVGNVALNSSLRLQERTQAIYLAQEGIELYRKTRDTSWIDGNPGNEINSKTALFTGGVTSLSGYLDSNGQFIQGSGEETITLDGIVFNRQATLSAVSLLPDLPGEASKRNALKITITVSWTGGTPVSSSEILTNWTPDF